MQREAIQPQLDIEAISKKKFVSKWSEEEDYPQEIKEAYKERPLSTQLQTSQERMLSPMLYLLRKKRRFQSFSITLLKPNKCEDSS